MKDLLNPYQKNSLRISLLTLEENLRRAQEWLDGREEKGILYHRKLELPDDKRKQASHIIKTALGVIENLSEKFELEAEPQNAASMFQGEFSVNWANLMDTQAGKLRRYGKVHPELHTMLDADVRKLAEIALQLSSILGESKQADS
jgi:hypothetical protein